MKRYLLLAVLAVGSAGALGCGGDASQAEPKFREPPRSTIGQIDDKVGSNGEARVVARVK